MKHSFRALLALLVTAVPLASCNKSGADVQISVWTTIGTQNQEVFNQMIAAFQDEYPNIEVLHTTQGGYDTLFDNLKTAIAGGNTPTMAYAYSDHVAAYLGANGAAKDMTPYMEGDHGFDVDEGWEPLTYMDKEGNVLPGSFENTTAYDDLIPGYLEEGQAYTIDGERLAGTYSLPFVKSSEALMYNKTYFEENNLDESKLATWGGVWELAEKILEIEGKGEDSVFPENANGQYAPLGYDSSDNMFIVFSKMLGIPYSDGTNELDPLSWYSARDNGGKALLKDLNRKYQSGLFINQTTASSYTSSAFVAQQCFMTISSTAGINYCIPEENDLFEVGVAPYPVMDEEYAKEILGEDLYAELLPNAQQNAAMTQGPSFTFFTRATEEQTEAAWLFYKYITGSYWNAVWAGETGYEPVRNSSYSEEAFLQSYETDTSLSDASENQEVRQAVAMGQIHNQIQNYGEENRMFASDVFVGSAESRQSVGGLLDGAILSTDFDNEIEGLYSQYYSEAMQALPII